ncbi:MAG: hypothetical protein ACREP8_10055 [Candidatus Binatia bacterium]
MRAFLKKQIRCLYLVLFFVAMTFADARAADPWDFLHDFELIPESVVSVDEHYVAALLHEPERDLLAVVIFTARCDPDRCEIKQPAAYSVFDTEGVRIQQYINPDEEELIHRISGGKIA